MKLVTVYVLVGGWRKERKPSISKAFKRFQASLKDLEQQIDENNKNNKLKNRHGAGVVPYDVLKPTSTYGITGRGVPYSVST
uniref:Lipoxygenase domain-containing protein n=1 Tax=Cucumis sativus TaxID=3659 RepID=A0A0A0L0K8_CUCSA